MSQFRLKEDFRDMLSIAYVYIQLMNRIPMIDDSWCHCATCKCK